MSSSNSSAPPAAALLVAAAAAGAAAGYLAGRRSAPAARPRAIPRKDPPPAHAPPVPSGGAPDGAPAGRLLADVSVPEVRLWDIENLGRRFEPHGGSGAAMGTGTDQSVRYNRIIGPDECVLRTVICRPGRSAPARAFLRAGPRASLHFDPRTVRAAVVTCGGLCPGLNNVIRELTCTLRHNYGAAEVLGIVGGFRGFHEDRYLPPKVLTTDAVADIHHGGGTFLQSSRGGFDVAKILTFLAEYEIDQLYVIGGDGTHRGAYAVHEGLTAAGMNVSVTGIPKTIDNDIDHIDRCFGFASAVEAAQAAIRSAKVEATCNLPNGIGIVKLMGRSAGYIAAFSSLGSGDVDLVLVPEVPTVLEGPNGCLPHLRRRVQEQGYAVVVVAEGAGEDILGQSAEVDAGGNRKLPQIGEFLRDRIAAHFAACGDEATVKYIDPSYMVRSVPANAADSQYCMQLAQNAVHGAMAGYTGCSVGLCNNRMVYLPIPVLVATSPRQMDAHGRTWERVVQTTRQPNTVPPRGEGGDPFEVTPDSNLH